VKEVKKKILVIVLAVAMLALPITSTVQAYKGGTPREIYHDLRVLGKLFPDYDPVPQMQGNMKCAEYTAYCAPVYILWDYDSAATPPWQGMLMGPATYKISYKINPNTMKGVVRLETKVTLPGGTFEGDMMWVGEMEVWDDGEGNHPYPNVVQPKSIKWHTFWKGTGAYEGWTILQDFNRMPPWVSGLDFAGDIHLIKPVD